MSTERALLELAAKAAGIKLLFPGEGIGGRDPRNAETIDVWNPLTDDGDALRLAVLLKLDVTHGTRGKCIFVGRCGGTLYEEAICHHPDAMAATRRAIVRAAAEIGRTMP